MNDQQISILDVNELAIFVLDALKVMSPHDREFFLERIDEEYCTGNCGCKKPTGDCVCGPCRY